MRGPNAFSIWSLICILAGASIGSADEWNRATVALADETTLDHDLNVLPVGLFTPGFDDGNDFLFGSLYAGTEMSFLQVNASTNGRINLSFDDSTTVGTDMSVVGGRGLRDTANASRIWMGWQATEHWGAVVRYWSLSDSEQQRPANAPGQTVTLPNFATVTEVGRAELNAFDVEGTGTFKWSGWTLYGSAGGRHANFDTHGEIFAFGVFTTGNFVNITLQNRSQFEGDGVTYSVGVRRAIGDSPFVFFVAGRGSNLSGRHFGLGRSAGTVADSPDPPLVGAATVTRIDRQATASIAEVQSGVQAEFELKRLPVTAFFRTAFEFQYWDMESLPVGGAGFGGTIGDLTTNSFSRAAFGEAMMYGLTLGTGFAW